MKTSPDEKADDGIENIAEKNADDNWRQECARKLQCKHDREHGQDPHAARQRFEVSRSRRGIVLGVLDGRRVSCCGRKCHHVSARGFGIKSDRAFCRLAPRHTACSPINISAKRVAIGSLLAVLQAGGAMRYAERTVFRFR